MYLLIFITAPSGAASATPVKMFVNLACDTGVALIFYLIFRWPALGDRPFFPYIVVPGVVGEESLTLWLMVMGVNNVQWKEQNERAAGS